MKIFDQISMCLRNLWRRKMRTFLTVFGVVIGTCAIVVMISLGVGIDQAQQQMLEGMGSLTLISVYEGYGLTDATGRPMESPKLNEAAVLSMRALPNVKAATGIMSFWNQEMAFQVKDRYLYQGTIMGIDFDSMPAFGYQLAEGRFPTKHEMKNTVIVGSEVEYQFVDSKRRRDNRVFPFPNENGVIKKPFVDLNKDRLMLNIAKTENNMGGGFAISRSYFGGSGGAGQKVEIPGGNGSYNFKVVGRLLSSEDGSSVDRSFDTKNTIYMDTKVMQEHLKEYQKKNRQKNQELTYNQVYVMVDSVHNVEAVTAAIKKQGYEGWSASSMRKELQKQTQTIQMVLGGLAGISLLVAALGITNTMVMSIYERTREIGVMKVLGCAVGNIRSVFLMEAGCIGFLGGLAGVLLSYIISFILNLVLGAGAGNMMGVYLDPSTSVQYSIIPIWLVLGAMLFAICIGLCSGFYPANRAVKISALEAIKSSGT